MSDEKKKDPKTKEESNSTPEKNIDSKLENLEYSKKIGDYILFDQIGMGTFSKVTRAFHLITQQTVAVKILDKEKIEDEIDIERIIREIEILKNIHHPNIAQMYETYSTIHNFYLMIEYVSGGDLFDYITSHNYLSEKKSCYFFRQIISVLEYLIELGISHRDIKPENILLNEEHTQIKFIDFGLSNYCSQNELLHSSCGSPCYASPEMLSGRAYKGTTTDLWSAGVVLYSMLVGALPFDDQELHKLYEQIKVGKFYIPSTLSLEAIDLLKRILEVDPKKRINLEGVKNHAWFKLEENPMYKGINISIEHFPCDTKVVNYVIKNYFKEDKEISSSIFVKMVHSHECNRYTATYYLVKSNILGIEEKFKIRKDKKKIEEKNKDNQDNKDIKENDNDNKNNKTDKKDKEKKIDDKTDIKEKDKENSKEKNKDKEDNDSNLILDNIINKKEENINTRNKKIEIKNNLGSTEKNDDIYFFTGGVEDENQKIRSKTEDNDIKQIKKNSNEEDDIFVFKDNQDKKKEDKSNEGNNKKSIKKNEKNKNKNKQDNSKKKSSTKDTKKSNKKNNNEIRTGKIAIPILNIKKSNNNIKLDEKCNTERPINNLKKSEQQKNYNKNKNNININNLKNSKNISNNNNKIQKNQLIIKNSSKNNMKKNKTNSPKSTNNLNFYVINNIINKDNKNGIYINDKDIQNGNINREQNAKDIFSFLPKTHEKFNSSLNDKKKVFDKIKINFKSSKDYKYARSPSDINLISKKYNSRQNNNSKNQLKYYKTSNNNDFNEAVLFSNRIKFKNSNKNNNTYNNSNLIIKALNNMNDKINVKNYDIYSTGVTNNILLYDNNMSNNGYISNLNQKNNLSVNQHNNYNSQNKKNDKKKNSNIFSNYIKQKNIYNLFNNDYSKNQTHQRNFKSALKYQLTEFKTENRVINNNIFLPKKKNVSRNKKSSYGKEYNNTSNTNFMSKNKNNNFIKEYTTKFLNNNQKHANSIDDSKNNFSSTPKYFDKTKNSRDKKIYFGNQNILNIDYLLKGKNKKNKLILTSTIGNGNNSPRNVYDIQQNYFGNAFHTEGNIKSNSTNKNKENLSVVLKKGLIRNQKKVNKDIFNIRPKDKNNNSEQKNPVNNSNNIYSNSKNKNNKNF